MSDQECLVPVYSDQNGIATILLYREDRETGSFRRYPGDPLRVVRDNIEGVSEAIGDLVSQRYDRESREWETPTICIGRNRPRSFYQFMRDGFKNREIHVATAASLHGRITHLKVHKLNLKANMSQGAKAVFAKRFMEALQLCADPELECLKDIA
jgi:hypothetical protein